MYTYTVEVQDDGTIRWYQNGQLHRLNGPAVEYSDGSCWWYQNGQIHRLDGPAIEHIDGTRQWWQNDHRHRLDGPAVEWSTGYREWYINGVQLSPQEFKAQTEPVEMTLTEICQALGKNVKIVNNSCTNQIFSV